jgi:hypothetical protein
MKAFLDTSSVIKLYHLISYCRLYYRKKSFVFYNDTERGQESQFFIDTPCPLFPL